VLHEKSCGAVVYVNNQAKTRYLLLNYAAGHWDFELQEETTITQAQFIDNFRESINYFYRRQGLTINKEVVFFIIESGADKVELSFEHVGFIWLDYQHAMEKLTFKSSKDTLQKAHDYLVKKSLVKD
jgi:hypothetical protein